MIEAIHAHGGKNYTIFLDRETLILFGYIEIEDEERWAKLAASADNGKFAGMPHSQERHPVLYAPFESLCIGVILAMGYKKDIFCSFAYEFDPLHKKKIRASTDEICYADEIFGYASDEIKSTHRLSDFIRPQGGFHRQRRFHLPARVDLVEKPTCRNKSVFLAGAERCLPYP